MSFTRYVSQLEITPGPAFAPFWSAFVQALRDTMSQDARQTRGPSTQSAIRVSTSVTNGGFTLVVEDDGPGADWRAVKTACEALGGSVETDTRPGDGATRIRFAFPNDGVLREDQAAAQRSHRRETSAA